MSSIFHVQLRYVRPQRKRWQSAPLASAAPDQATVISMFQLHRRVISPSGAKRSRQPAMRGRLAPIAPAR
eukprot:11169741-Lingulodinium_polyedra.AAC.1